MAGARRCGHAPWSTRPGPGSRASCERAGSARRLAPSGCGWSRARTSSCRGSIDGDHPYILQNDDKRIVFVIPYRGRLHPDRHHRRALRGRPRRRAAITPGRDRLSLPRGQPLLQQRDRAGGRGLVLCRRAAALRRCQRRRLGGDPRLRASTSTPAGPGAAAVGLRRQDHDLPQARRARAGEAAAACMGFAARPWTADAALPGGDIAGRRLRRPSLRALRGATHPVAAGAAARGAGRAPTARALGASSAAARAGSTISGGISAAACTRREVRYLVDEEWARTADDILWRRSQARPACRRRTRRAGCEASWMRPEPRSRRRRQRHEPAAWTGSPRWSARDLDRRRRRSSSAPGSSTCCSGRRWPARPR